MKSIAVLSLMMAVLVGLTAGLCMAADPGTLAASVTTEGLPFPCIAGASCKVTLEYANSGDKSADLKDWAASCVFEGNKIEASVDPGAPASVEAGKSAVASLTFSLPESAGGKDVVLACSVNAGGSVVKADIPLSVTPIFEITLLPQRLILDPTGSKTMGMSVINHVDKQFTGKVTITVNGALSVDPSQIDANIEPLGLEPYMIKIGPAGKLAPGHYTLWVDVGGKSKEWAMIDMPAVAKRATIKVDGKLDDWKNVQSVSISRYDGSRSLTIGTARFAHDAKNLYVAVELSGDTAEAPDAVLVAFDPLIDGARDVKGGFRADDREYAIAVNQSASTLTRVAAGSNSNKEATKFPVGMAIQGAKTAYETAIPWTELTALKSGTDPMIAVSVLVNAADGAKYELGGGLADNIDPRLFVPVVLGK